jgi:2-dehydropantoate 2-reductase
MKIAIIGAGAMGCLYGAKLSVKSENEVHLLDVWKDHIDAINANGLRMEEGDGVLVYENLKGHTSAKEAGVCDLVIVFVKSTLTKTAVESNAAVFGPDTIALTLQNGLGNIEQISSVIGAERVIAGTTAHGATMLSPGRMRHAGKGKTIMGELDGSESARIMKIAAVLEDAGMETAVSGKVLGLLWDKLLVNVGINALTGITKLHNGQLLDYPEIEELLEKAVSEGVAVAKAKGIALGFDNPVAHTKDICKATAANKSSMLQDILKGRKTEIDTMNGAIVREGKAMGIETPVNLALTNIITFISRELK